jgi:hypothetical protein
MSSTSRREGIPVARVSRRSVVAGAVGVLVVGAVVVGAASSGASRPPGVPAAPPTSDTQVSYDGYTYNPTNDEAVRRLAAGEDPRTIPGVVAVSSPDTAPLPSSTGSTPGGEQTIR